MEAVLKRQAVPLPTTSPPLQVLQKLCPALGWKRPAAHPMQSLLSASAYLPATHARHVPSCGTVPAGHASQLRLVADAGHETAHASYALTALPAELVPVAQDASHDSAPGPVATKLSQPYTSPWSV